MRTTFEGVHFADYTKILKYPSFFVFSPELFIVRHLFKLNVPFSGCYAILKIMTKWLKTKHYQVILEHFQVILQGPLPCLPNQPTALEPLRQNIFSPTQLNPAEPSRTPLFAQWTLTVFNPLLLENCRHIEWWSPPPLKWSNHDPTPLKGAPSSAPEQPLFRRNHVQD